MTASTPGTRPESHTLERTIQRELLRSEDGVTFGSLVVRRVSGDSICLQGVIYANDDDVDGGDEIETLVRKVAGVDSVLNHLVVQPPSDA